MVSLGLPRCRGVYGSMDESDDDSEDDDVDIAEDSSDDDVSKLSGEVF